MAVNNATSSVYKHIRNSTPVLGSEIVGTVTVDTVVIDTEITMGNIKIGGNTIESINLNGDINIIPDGSGEVLLNANPTSALGAATKQYVDAVAGGGGAVTLVNITDFGSVAGPNLANLNGNMSIGTTSYGATAAPTNGLLVNGNITTDGQYQIGGVQIDTNALSNMNVTSATNGDTLRYSGGSDFVNIANNYTAVTNPGTGDDSGDNYQVGSIWVNTSTDAVYVCTDNTATAAVWVEVTAGSSLGRSIDWTSAGTITYTGTLGTPTAAPITYKFSNNVLYLRVFSEFVTTGTSVSIKISNANFNGLGFPTDQGGLLSNENGTHSGDNVPDFSAGAQFSLCHYDIVYADGDDSVTINLNAGLFNQANENGNRIREMIVINLSSS